jgi:hypothetical protein
LCHFLFQEARAVIPLLIVAAVVLFAVTGVLGHGQKRLDQHGIHALTWRWLTGHPWHGTAITDAGWLRPGQKALTRTGYAPRFHFRPRWQRTAMRSGSALAFIVILYGVIVNLWLTIDLLLAITGLLVVAGCWRAWLRWQRRKHRRAWVEPVHAIVAPMVGIPVANSPRSWLAIEPDRSKAVFQLPPGTDFSDPKLQEKVVRAASRTLGIESPEPKWALAGPEPTLTITPLQPPPDKVVLADIREWFDKIGPDDLVVGFGRGGVIVILSLHGDSPHLGLTMGSGAGKSVTARFFGAQMLYHGAILVILDVKRISHMWAKGLPNVAYARDDEELHELLLALQAEVQRRNVLADQTADIEGNVQGNVGPRIFLIAEELNAAMKRLRAYWRRERGAGDPVRSPALDALDEILFTGRQVRVNVLMIGQRLSAEATGGGDARENLAGLIFARYKPSTWKMLVPDLAMPPPTRHVGRCEVVTDTVRTTQVAYLTGREARELALAGRVSEVRKWWPNCPYAGEPLAETVTQDELESRPEQGFDTVSPGQNGQPPAIETANPVGLRYACAEGIVPKSLAAARDDRHRDEAFPKPVGRRGLESLYDPLDLADYYERKGAV